MLSSSLRSPDLDFLTLVMRSWSGESVSESVKLSRMNLEALVGEAALGDTSSLADLVWVGSLPLLIGAPTEEGLECWTVGPWCKGG